MENEIPVEQSLMLMDSILSRVDAYYTELLIEKCKPYQMEVRSNHVTGILYYRQPDFC